MLRFRPFALLTLAALAVAAAPSAQPTSTEALIARERAYANAIDAAPVADAVYLRARRAPQPEGVSDEDWEFHLRHGATRLAEMGYTLGELDRLRREGLDLVDAAVRAPRMLSPAERAALSDLVVVGAVQGCEDDLTPGDGFRRTVTLRVVEVLRGEWRSPYLALREYSGRTSDGNEGRLSHATSCTPGETFVFYTSASRYAYYVQNPALVADRVRPGLVTGRASPDAELTRYHVRVGQPVRITRETPQTEHIGEVRRAARLLR